MSQDRYLKLKEVQNLLGVSRSTVWRWHAERGLRVVSVGGVTRVRESDLEAFVNRHLRDEPLAKPAAAAVNPENSD